MKEEVFKNTDSDRRMEEEKIKPPRSWKFFRDSFLDKPIKGLRNKRKKDIKDMVHGNIFGAGGREVGIKMTKGPKVWEEIEKREKRVRKKYQRAYKIFLELVEARGVEIKWSPLSASSVLGSYHPEENKIILHREVGTENRLLRENLGVLVHEFVHALDYDNQGKKSTDEYNPARDELIATAVEYLFVSGIFKRDGFTPPFFQTKYAKESGATEKDLKELEQYIFELHQKLRNLYLSIEAEYIEE